MKKLEDKILNKIYQFETKRTAGEIVMRVITIIFTGFFSFILFLLFFDSLITQGSLDLLDIFNDDFEVTKRYFFDNIFIFFEEVPKLILLLTVVTVILTLVFIIILIKNFRIIKNKVKSIINYLFK